MSEKKEDKSKRPETKKAPPPRPKPNEEPWSVGGKVDKPKEGDKP